MELKEIEDEGEIHPSGADESQSAVPKAATDVPDVNSNRSSSPEIEVHLFRGGKGPIDVFKSKLGGWGQDSLEVQDILDKYGFKSIYAFNPSSGRGVPIRFNHKNGRSILPYRPGAVIYVDGEPRDSLIKPISKILLGVAFLTLLISVFVKETPAWIKNSDFMGRMFPPWVIACIVIVFTRLRKRTRQFLKRYGW
ncbi:uncharacterized protein LOC116255609 [Nymphaea colorata]|nr:uncharacterized protein LOC116255609 [Nymphaea colorata]